MDHISASSTRNTTVTNRQTDRPSLRNFDRVYLICKKTSHHYASTQTTLKVPRQHANYKAKASQRSDPLTRSGPQQANTGLASG